jgi:hypothetical protein
VVADGRLALAELLTKGTHVLFATIQNDDDLKASRVAYMF